MFVCHTIEHPVLTTNSPMTSAYMTFPPEFYLAFQNAQLCPRWPTRSALPLPEHNNSEIDISQNGLGPRPEIDVSLKLINSCEKELLRQLTFVLANGWSRLGNTRGGTDVLCVGWARRLTDYATEVIWVGQSSTVQRPTSVQGGNWSGEISEEITVEIVIF